MSRFVAALLGCAVACACRPADSATQDPVRGATSRPSQGPASQPTSQPSAPQPSADATGHARFVKVGADEGRFETAIVEFTRPDGVRVALIAAVHLADAAHYAELQKEFERYDALLYELVASPDVRPTPGEDRPASGLGLIQQGLSTGLQLAFQLDSIDYTPANFVHADLTPAGFQDEMERRGESFLTILLDLMQHGGQMQADARERSEDEPPPPKVDFVKAMRTGEGRHALRMLVAEQLNQIESLASGGDGSVLLEGRNDRALEVLREQLAAGKRTVGIYYGAAHMPDMAKKLAAMGFTETSRRWLLAWDITKRPDRPKPKKKD